MADKLTLDDLLGAGEWEGGIGELIEHGVNIYDYDVSNEFQNAWSEAEEAYGRFADLRDWLNDELYSGE